MYVIGHIEALRSNRENAASAAHFDDLKAAVVAFMDLQIAHMSEIYGSDEVGRSPTPSI